MSGHLLLKLLACLAQSLLIVSCLCFAIEGHAQTSIAEIQGVSGAQSELAKERFKGKGGVNANNNAGAAADADAAEVDAADAASNFATAISKESFSFLRVLKIVFVFIVFWMWVGATDWVSRDAQTYRLGHFKWNAINFFPFVVVGLLLFFLPLSLYITAPTMLVVFLATWIPYVVVHNKNVGSHQTVLTGPWWRFAFANVMGRVGVKIDAERKAEYEKGEPVDLIAMGAEDTNADNANLLSARNSPGYLLLKDLIADMSRRRVDRVLLDFSQQGVSVKHEIDGMWHNGEVIEREGGDVMLAVMKTLSNLDVRERRKKQEGRFGAKYKGKSYLCPLTAGGVKTGERVMMYLQGEKQEFSSYDDLGMRGAIQNKWGELLAADQGLVILAAMPGGGLTTITNVSIEETDRLMRDFVSIEEVSHHDPEIQNVAAHTYDASAGETPATLMPKLIRSYPNVYICRDFVDGESAKLLVNEVKDEKLVITTVRAKEAAEAPLRILQMKVPPKDFARALTGVLYQRLVRKLCTDCRVAYVPSPQVLKKLGIPPGKVEKLYRPPKPEEIDKPCKFCQGLGYVGRTGLFELLVIDDKMREILIKQPKVDLLKKAARASHQRLMQEEGILLVAKGVTSLPELTRVMKQ